MISSSATIAVLGPPMPVACTVSACPSSGDPAVAPEAAIVVEHLRHPGDQLLGEPERAAGVAGEENALGDGFVRAEVDGLWRHAARYRTKLPVAMAKDKKKKDKKDDKSVEPDALAAVRAAVERTLHASVEGAHRHRSGPARS